MGKVHMQFQRYIAIDFGAESGRIIVGTIANDKLEMEEISRFRTQGTMLQGNLRWNVIRFWEEIQTGLQKYVDKYGPEASGIGVDTWGVSIIGLNSNDDLAYTPFHYRASIIADPVLDEFIQKIGKKKIFETTGVQFMPINTSTHLYAMFEKMPDIMKNVKNFLFIPDYFNFLLTGKKSTEYTIASTSQLLDVHKRSWAENLIKTIGGNPGIFPAIKMPGQILAPITDEIRELTGLGKIPVHLVASHDTASAIAAIPHTDPSISWVYLSSGTWSLLGIEVSEPVVNDQVRRYNLTNEGGIDSTIRLLKNIMGLWLLQECKREWDKEEESLDYGKITLAAEQASQFRSIISVDDARFFAPKSMLNEIIHFCSETGQPIPESRGEIARCIFESLALRYLEIIEVLQSITSQHIEQIHIVGGGSKNKFLCQLTADATGREVIAGPVEATAIGNLLMQAKSCGYIKDINHLRRIVSTSFPVDRYSPQPTERDGWKKAYKQYLNLVK
jgi:sugar (pentulose or hexulose) kinase